MPATLARLFSDYTRAVRDRRAARQPAGALLPSARIDCDGACLALGRGVPDREAPAGLRARGHLRARLRGRASAAAEPRARLAVGRDAQAHGSRARHLVVGGRPARDLLLPLP